MGEAQAPTSSGIWKWIALGLILFLIWPVAIALLMALWPIGVAVLVWWIIKLRNAIKPMNDPLTYEEEKEGTNGTA